MLLSTPRADVLLNRHLEDDYVSVVVKHKYGGHTIQSTPLILTTDEAQELVAMLTALLTKEGEV